MPDEKPAQMRWNGTAERGLEIQQWARDAAMLPYAQLSKTGDPDEPYRLLLKVDLPDGQGNQWVTVPKGAVVHFGGSEVDPQFSFQEGRKAQAAAFVAHHQV